jgi:hypothetical protein
MTKKTTKKKPARRMADIYEPKTTAVDKPVLNIWQRISAIQADVTAVAKSADVANQYKAVTHDDVTRMLRPLMVKHGVVSKISITKNEMVDTGVMWRSRPLFQMRAEFVVTYMNIDDPKDFFCTVVVAHADDAGDKAPGKVFSYAQKYADMKTFRVQTGEDDEQRIDPETLTEPTLTADHLAELFEFAEANLGDDADAVMTSMATKVFQVPNYAAILDKHFDVAMANQQTVSGLP